MDLRTISVDERFKIATKAIQTGDLMEYKDHRYFGVFCRKEYYEKWERIVKWPDGSFKYAIIIGKYRDMVVIELDEGGIFTVSPKNLQPWVKGYKNLRWKPMDPSSMLINICI